MAMPDQLRTRLTAPSPAAIDADLAIEPGRFDDYRTLSLFHYKGKRPGAVTSVLRIVNRRPTVIGRYLKRGPASEVVGVLVRSMPPLCCHLRDVATGNRYRGLSRREAAIMLNREVRIISRVVIDPRWRGLGLAVRLVKHALARPEEEIVFTEALAAMGRVSPFFEQAGMMRYERPPQRGRAEHARLLDALDHVRVQPVALASNALLAPQLAALSAAQRAWLEAELRRWRRASARLSTRELASLSFADLLNDAGRELLIDPVYYIYSHQPPAAFQPHPRSTPPRPHSTADAGF